MPTLTKMSVMLLFLLLINTPSSLMVMLMTVMLLLPNVVDDLQGVYDTIFINENGMVCGGMLSVKTVSMGGLANFIPIKL